MIRLFLHGTLRGLKPPYPPPSGRCTNGGKCTAPHTTDPAEIMCNSTVAPGEKAGLSNKTYGYCHLVLKGLKCPYKECIHDGVDPKTDASMDETGE